MKLSTPEKQAAFEQLKEFVLAVVPAGEIEAHAFRLVGEEHAAIDANAASHREARELFELLLTSYPQLPRGTALGLAFAFHRLLCERILEIDNGIGHA